MIKYRSCQNFLSACALDASVYRCVFQVLRSRRQHLICGQRSTISQVPLSAMRWKLYLQAFRVTNAQLGIGLALPLQLNVRLAAGNTTDSREPPRE